MSDTSRRSPMAPTKLSPQDYRRAVGNHLKTYEGVVPRIYTDDDGIPTMGSGVALAAKNQDKIFVLRDLNEIGAEISGDPAKPYRFTAEEAKLLNDTVGKLNDSQLTDRVRKSEAQKLIPPYKPGETTVDGNKFGFTLSDERIAKQAEAAWTVHRDRAIQTVRTQAKARGWSKDETNAYIKSLEGSQQEIALTSLAYNGVPTPKATGAMLDGDPVALRQEILYRSNPPEGGAKRKGYAERRKTEADLASGPLEDWTQQQREQLRQSEASPDAKRYRDTFPETFPQYGPPQDTGLSTLRPEPRPQDAVDQGEPSPQPEPQPAPEREQKQSEAPADPRVSAMTEMAAMPVANPGRSALLKPVEKLTEGEMMDMIASAQGDYRGWRSGDPLKAHTYEKVQDWHASIYGDQPQGNDGGKPIEPMPIRPIPEQPSPHTTPQGEDLWQATARLGGKLAAAAGMDGYAQTVQGLQRGLNMLNNANPLPARSAAYGPYTKLGPVDEDGQYGPQTDFALKHATARLGPAKVEDGLALGRFNTFARAAQSSGNAEGLENKTHAIFGPLLHKDDQAPKVEGGALQMALNGFGQNLKVDNWIGPKTTQAFADVLKEQDSDTLTRSLGRELGML
ncbi:hypothetical protein [Magnetospirillum aberrantis]|uniref:Uncharacterized protein n=1 Tax=Magnetospirillum aberrantis SpK TaxID=908842 RepID=A0A7C9QV82_9PROT|nr:hypothetical protein [Magnetospirillum aberrantis]NFV81001.1 hypothetical protein [Magnetospirillum aberrantis SpK]